MTTSPAVHLAIPVDDLGAARRFYSDVLGLAEGRSTDHWVDWDLHGHQLVTHLVDGGPVPAGTSAVDGHAVPIPHFGLLLATDDFHRLADRLRAAGVDFVVEPYRRFPDEPAEQWTMFFHDPAGNALEFKAFRDSSKVFAR
ncbi:VOC family protein [Umezawaea tangerina]|nr:VOC family protein [Umezawaea tangerina]